MCKDTKYLESSGLLAKKNKLIVELFGRKKKNVYLCSVLNLKYGGHNMGTGAKK